MFHLHTSFPSLWRPWLPTRNAPQRGCERSRQSCPSSSPTESNPTAPSVVQFSGKSQSFQHPVRLFWPKSKSFDYLYSDGEALLRNFPVQATISFYDESDSEDEDNEWEEEADSEEEECLKPQSHFSSYN
ncbi:protein ripply1 isoform X2 [Esox lucius]|uniref:protein ripply1 isoform X2 n=1 Tax=Esox lucius TaxID=8010 RepID=UPI0014771010|nr:protein ripply1 isoform X2 [Esox lucius]